MRLTKYAGKHKIILLILGLVFIFIASNVNVFEAFENRVYLNEFPTIPYEDKEINLKFLYPPSWTFETSSRSSCGVKIKTFILISGYKRKGLLSSIKIEFIPKEAAEETTKIENLKNEWLPDFQETVHINGREFLKYGEKYKDKRSYRELWFTKSETGIYFIEVGMIEYNDPLFLVVDRILGTIKI